MLAVACGTEIGDVSAHCLENGEASVEICLIAAYQNGKRSSTGPAVTAGDGGVQHSQSPGGALLVDPLGQGGAGGGHVDERHALGGAVQNIAGGKVDLLHILGEAHHGDDHLAGLYALRNAAVGYGTLGYHVCHFFRVTGINVDLVARFHQVPHHGFPHDAYADPADPLHIDPSCVIFFSMTHLKRGVKRNNCPCCKYT